MVYPCVPWSQLRQLLHKVLTLNLCSLLPTGCGLDDSMSWKSEFTCWEKVWIPWVISDRSVLYPINTPLINIPINPLFILNEHSTPINPFISFFPTKNDPVDGSRPSTHRASQTHKQQSGEINILIS